VRNSMRRAARMGRCWLQKNVRHRQRPRNNCQRVSVTIEHLKLTLTKAWRFWEPNDYWLTRVCILRGLA
jgi:hypothetical protein